MRISLHAFTTAWLCLGITFPAIADDDGVDLTTIDRTIVREPVYQGQPHYALLVFGLKAKDRAWLIVDGDNVAFIDRNGNGDLTDPDDRVELDIKATKNQQFGGSSAYLGMNVFPLGDVFGTNLSLSIRVRNPAYDTSQDKLSHDHFRKFDEKKWVDGLLIRSFMNPTKTQSINSLLLTGQPAESQISHFYGPLTFELAQGDEQKLESWPMPSVLDVRIGWRNLCAKNCNDPSFLLTRIATAEIPVNIHPIATLTYRDSFTDDPPTEQTIHFDERRFGDSFCASMQLSKKVKGDAVAMKVEFPAGSGLSFQPAEFKIPIRRRKESPDEAMFVMSDNPHLSLKQVVSPLRKRGLDVTIEDKRLRIQKDFLPQMYISFDRSAEAQESATEFGLNSEFAKSLANCDARFSVVIHDAEKWLQEKQTLLAVREVLQKVTDGFAYSTWDKQLIAPP